MQKMVDISQYEQERGKPMPSELHAYVQGKLISKLDNAYEDKYSFFSELSLELNTWESVPDIAIYPKRKLNFREDRIQVTTAPLCAIEILSPSQSLQELVSKADKYFSYGVQSCWLVIPSLENIYVFSSSDVYTIFRANQTLVDSALGIELELAKIFA
jgi:Uma2 family endonuclease